MNNYVPYASRKTNIGGKKNKEPDASANFAMDVSTSSMSQRNKAQRRTGSRRTPHRGSAFLPTSRRLRSWLFNGLFCGLLITGVFGEARAEPLSWWQWPATWFNNVLFAPVKNDMAPLQLGYSLHGRKVSLADYRGFYVLVNFWATWCPPCRRELPILEAFDQDNPHEDLAILAVNVHGDEDELREFLRAYPLKLTVLHDREGEVVKAYAISPIPTSFLIGKDGEILNKWEGEMDPVILERLINKE